MTVNDTSIISIVMRVIIYFLNLFLIFSLIKKEVKLKNMIVTAFCISVLCETALMFVPEDLKYLIPFVIVIPIVSYFYKVNIIKSLLADLLANIIVGLTDVVISISIFCYLQVDSIEDVTNNTIVYYAGFVLLCVAIVLIANIIKLVNYSIGASDEDKRVDFGIIFNYIFTFLLIFPNAFILLAYLEDKPLSLSNIMISLVSMIAMFILSIFNAQKRYNLIISEKEIEYQKSYNATLQSLVDGLRTFKHDYNNTLATLYGYVQLEDIKSLKRVFKEVLEESKTLTTLDKLNPDLIKNPSIYGLITSKYQKCEKSNVKMNIEIFADLEGIDIKTFDLTRILGIFLDNAIEAASSSKEKKINLLLTEVNNKIIIELSNTFTDKAIAIDKIFEKGISTKGENRGLGLYEVKEIVKKCPGVYLETAVNDKMFLQKLTLRKVLKASEV